MVAAGNPNATETQIDRALNDEDWTVRLIAAGNPNATEANLNKALNDKNSSVRAYAARRLKGD